MSEEQAEDVNEVLEMSRLKPYMQYFKFSGDGNFYVRTDFREKIKELGGKDLTLLFRILFGDENRDLLIKSFEAGNNIRNKSLVYKKAKIPNDIRWSVWERDNFTCKKCGTRKNLSIDHIIPESKGGQTTIENCQTLCRVCNSKKGDR